MIVTRCALSDGNARGDHDTTNSATSARVAVDEVKSRSWTPQDTGEWWIRPAAKVPASARLIVLQCSPRNWFRVQGRARVGTADLPSASAGAIDRRAVVRVARNVKKNRRKHAPPTPKGSKGLVREIRVHTSLISTVVKWQMEVTPPGTTLVFLAAAADSVVPARRKRRKGSPPQNAAPLFASRFSKIKGGWVV
jgi:hypothetical protein